MTDKPDHYALYEGISDWIDYCNDNGLPQTKDILTVAISILSQEERQDNSLAKAKIILYPISRLT